MGSESESVPEILKKNTTTIEFARIYGTMVLKSAEEVGMSAGDLSSMKTRMMTWTKIVATYEAEIAELSSNTSMKPYERASLTNEMREALTGIRVEMFGD